MPILCLALLAGTAIKLFYALTTIGTNDVYYWHTFMRYIVKHGSVNIYRDIWYYNHPPLMSLFLELCAKLQHYFYNGFPFLMRLPAIIADIGSFILIYRLLKTYQESQKAFYSALLFALSPIMIFISGFHGNTDPVFLFLILLAAYFFLRNSLSLSALSLGLAINIKIVPLITIPVFFFFIESRKKKLQFCGILMFAFAAGFAYHLANNFACVYRNIFSYGGLQGIWGISQVLSFHFGPEIVAKYLPVGKLLIFLTIVVSAYRLSLHHSGNRESTFFQEGRQLEQKKGNDFLFALSWTFMLFFVFTPGFGVQYLAWMVVPGILLGLRGALFINITGGLFLFLVYTFWCGGTPWHYADSDSMGVWHGWPEFLALLLWLFIFLWAIQIFLSERQKFIGIVDQNGKE